MAKRACVLCGEMAGSWSLCYITLCGTSQTLCEKCMRRYRDAAGEEKIALREYMARSPHLREGEEVRERLPQARVQWQRELEQALCTGNHAECHPGEKDRPLLRPGHDQAGGIHLSAGGAHLFGR